MADYPSRTEQRLVAVEVAVRGLQGDVVTLQKRQDEHRAILVGDELEGNGGLRNQLMVARRDLEKRLNRQNLFLYGILGLALLEAPTNIKDVVAFVVKILSH